MVRKGNIRAAVQHWTSLGFPPALGEALLSHVAPMHHQPLKRTSGQRRGTSSSSGVTLDMDHLDNILASLRRRSYTTPEDKAAVYAILVSTCESRGDLGAMRRVVGEMDELGYSRSMATKLSLMKHLHHEVLQNRAAQAFCQGASLTRAVGH